MCIQNEQNENKLTNMHYGSSHTHINSLEIEIKINKLTNIIEYILYSE